MQRKRNNIFQYSDWFLIGLFLVLCLLGWFNIYAATYNDEHQSMFDISQNYGKQLIWIITAFVIAMLVLMLDSKFFETFAYVIYGLGIFLLVAVLIFGKEIKGQKAWFEIGIFRLQPSELAKYGTALVMTKFLSGLNTKLNNWKNLLRAGLILAIPAALIMLQPDTGSTLVYGAFVFVMYREGLYGNVLLFGLFAIIFFILSILLSSSFFNLPFDIVLAGNHFFILILAIIALIAYYILRRHKGIILFLSLAFVLSSGFVLSTNYVFNEILGAHQKARINELLGVTSDPKGVGYNVHQSKIAIGSGGFFGKGFLQGTQTKYNFVPEQSTDFIFCTVGEEWGFFGSFMVLCIFIVLFFRLIFVAERQKNRFNRIYGYSVASIFFFHFLVNIGMTIGLVPVIGIPLPFFSYGGSSLWAFTILLFTFIKMDSDRMQSLS